MKTPRKIQEFSSINETVTRVFCGPDNTAVITGLYRKSNSCKRQVLTWLSLVREKSETLRLSQQKVDILKKTQSKLKQSKRLFWDHCDLTVIFLNREGKCIENLLVLMN